MFFTWLKLLQSGADKEAVIRGTAQRCLDKTVVKVVEALSWNAVTGLDLNFRIKAGRSQRARCNPPQHTQI